ncbi:hypothetical protein HF086_008057 [Spodoptera exigua]|uniref:Neutral ceramidase n=1 Tax=Spodoptera exigua TaxID=7107 RepID=A0A922SIS2_SPOEX|nr:hypothetical protein HF086_008057 [Spodoptera exigua]
MLYNTSQWALNLKCSIIYLQVIKRLQKRYGGLYGEQNVIISGTHTHSTPGGFLMDFLFDLPILGFVRETYAAYIVGIYKSIVIAHNKLTEARVLYGEAELLDANINRSPTSYLKNPPEERARYKYDTDKTLSQIRFVSPENKILGVINWFAVHPTSMNNTNKLISSDNVGYASILMEKALNGNTTLPGKGNIVCAFASTNLGDVSPNTKGPHCEFSGKPCDQEKLLCKRPKERCFASGPGRDMFDSTRIIATKLFQTAMSVLNEPGEDLTGPLGIKHQYVKMPEQAVAPYDPVTETFNTAKFPYEWQPKVVSCAVARIGGLLLAAVPGEFTTMSGRRLRNVIAKTAPEAKKVVIAGLSNIYSDYIATPEEYQAQRYEAASTIYGPHTLDIYLNKYVELTEALISSKTIPQGPEPPDLSTQLISLVPPVLWDSAPWGHEFGDCLKQPFKQYSYGDVVMAQFVSGHPRNSIRHGRWYATIERLESEEDDAWTTVFTDADWETKYTWIRDSKVMGTSRAEIEWEIPVGTPKGIYRIHHFGNYKYVLGGIYPYHGFTDSFEVS